ncbi:MAG: hypothetical protein R3E57_07340 [Porticoccaceae bacterium]
MNEKGITLPKESQKRGYFNFLIDAIKLEVKSTFQLVAAPFKSAASGSTADIQKAIKENEENSKKLVERYCDPR